MLANVLPRQSVSSAISWSIRSDGFIGYLSRSAKRSVTSPFLFFCGNDRAFAKPHAAEKAVFQRELMVERGGDMACDQNGQQCCKNRMDPERGQHGESLGQRFAMARNAPLISHPVDHPLAIIRNTITYRL